MFAFTAGGRGGGAGKCPAGMRGVARCHRLLLSGALLASVGCGNQAPGTTMAGARPTPLEEVFNGCPGQGLGSDSQLNLLKNRVDEADWQPATPDALLQLTWPPGVAGRRMSAWAASDRAQIEPNNGQPVQVEGYLLEVRQQEPESTNCDTPDPASRDFHGWLAALPTHDRATRSLIVEFTPRVRAKHPRWTLRTLQLVARDRARVRISGWTMLDPDHPDEVGKSRGTLWKSTPSCESRPPSRAAAGRSSKGKCFSERSRR